MFGKKKDEEWDYVGDYYQSGEYQQDGSQQDRRYSDAYKDELKAMFEHNLMEGEEIICVSGGGDTKAKLPFETDKMEKVEKKINIIKYVFIAVLLVPFLIPILGDKFIGPAIFVTIVGAIVTWISPILIIGAVVLFIVWYIKKGQKGLNYAITDRRIICFAYGRWQEIPLQCITNTSVKMKKDNKGTINIKARNVPNMGGYVGYMVPWIDDPHRVKYMLDAAIEKCKSNQF